MRQCKACPWKVGTHPDRNSIPGYNRAKHERLRSTIAKDGEINISLLRIMVCHESSSEDAIPCVGWVMNQLREDNIGLRICAIDGRFDAYETVGPQHERFEDTIPDQED